MKHLTYNEALKAFMTKANELYPNYDKIPSMQYSSCRMGGWIMKDVDDMMIGWSGHRGDVTVYDYVPQTSETIKEYRVK
jgi:hypothetical protein